MNEMSHLEIGSLADWTSGFATLLATIVALGSYRWADNQRKAEERKRRQDHAYQIGYKLATLISEAASTHKSLVPKGTTFEQWNNISDPFQIVGAQTPALGFGVSMARDLTDAEQNLLMSLREEGFLMNMTETAARNETIREGMIDYKLKHDAITAKLPPPDITTGQIAGHNLTQQQIKALWPFVMPAASLLTSLRSLSEENVAMLSQMGAGFHQMMQSHFPDLHIHKIQEVTDEAKDAQSNS